MSRSDRENYLIALALFNMQVEASLPSCHCTGNGKIKNRGFAEFTRPWCVQCDSCAIQTAYYETVSEAEDAWKISMGLFKAEVTTKTDRKYVDVSHREFAERNK